MVGTKLTFYWPHHKSLKAIYGTSDRGSKCMFKNACPSTISIHMASSFYVVLCKYQVRMTYRTLCNPSPSCWAPIHCWLLKPCRRDWPHWWAAEWGEASRRWLWRQASGWQSTLGSRASRCYGRSHWISYVELGAAIFNWGELEIASGNTNDLARSTRD